MIISNKVQTAALSMLNGVSALTPELMELKRLTVEELKKGKGVRNLKLHIDILVPLGDRGSKLGKQFVKDCLDGVSAEEESEIITQAAALRDALTNGDTESLELSIPLKYAIQIHGVEQEQLNSPVDGIDMKKDLMSAVAEDGLLEYFFEEMHKVMCPGEPVDEESIKAFVASTSSTEA